MDDYESFKFRETNPRFPDLDFTQLSSIKINSKITINQCERMLDLLEQKIDVKQTASQPSPKPLSIDSNQNVEPKNEKQIQSCSKFFDIDDDESIIKPKQRQIIKRPNFVDNDDDDDDVVPVVKRKQKQITKRPIINDDDDDELLVGIHSRFSKKLPSPLRKPFQKQDEKMAFQVVYGRYKPYKKNKEWTFDGFLFVKPDGIILYKCSGSILGRIERNDDGVPKFITKDTRLVIGQWECEVCDQLIVDEFEKGEFFAPDEND